MPMYDPPPPGFVLAENFETEEAEQAAAAKIGLSYDAFKQILQGKAPITPEIAYLLHDELNLMVPKMWIGMQAAYDSWQAAHNKQWQKAVRQKFLHKAMQQDDSISGTPQMHQFA